MTDPEPRPAGETPELPNLDVAISPSSARSRRRWIRTAAGIAIAAGVLIVGVAALLRERAADRKTLLSAVQAARTGARLMAEQGRLDDAEQSVRHAVGLAEKLVASAPNDPASRRERVAALETMGEILERIGLSREAVETFRLSIELRGLLLAEDPGSVADRVRMAESLDRLATLLRDAGRWDEAEQPLVRGSALCLPDLPSVSSDRRVRDCLSSMVGHRGRLLMDRGQRAEGIQALEEAVKIQDELVLASPGDPGSRHRLIERLLELSRAMAADGRPDEAERILSRAAEHTGRLRKDDPGVSGLEVSATILEEQAALLRRDPKGASTATSCLEQAIGLREVAAGASPGSSDPIANLSADCDALAGLLQERAALEQAEALYRRALACQSRRLAERPEVAGCRHAHGRALHNLAELLRVRGRLEEALRLQDDAVRELKSLYRAHQNDPAVRRALSYAYWTLCSIHLDRKDHRSAANCIVDYLRIEPNGYEESIEASQFLCRCARILAEDQGLTSDDRDTCLRAYREQALRALRTAIQNGYRDTATLLSSPAYEPIRALGDFRRLIERIENLERPVAGEP